MTLSKINYIDKNKNNKSSSLDKYGLKESDFVNDKFKEHIKTHLRKNIQKGINKLIDVKDKKEEIAGSNGKEIFAIPTREGKSIPINTYDMDEIIKGMVPAIQKIDPNFINKVKSQIQELCKQNGIDETFCFQQGSKERFEQIDSMQPVKEMKTDDTKIIQTNKIENKKMTTKNTKSDTLKNATEINSSDIVELINPKLLEQKIELPNGVRIPAKQYVQEVVAPYIPSSGTFILNNSSQISAKQYIEEYILSAKQYKGDISKLLSENTISNNGTIMVKGEQIDAIDIVDTLNPDLMSRNVKLPNGVEISARQYIQEIVAPHIPSDGKFILKNGLGLSAKQFIEEAVMFVGQEKYNGDIIALLKDMTVANNGTVSVETKTKAPRGQGLKQEVGISPLEIQKSKRIPANSLENDIQKGISNEKVMIDIDDVQNAQQEIADRNKYKRLMIMGKNRTVEQEERE